VGYVTITDLTRVINNTASRTMQPLLTISIGMLIYLGLSYIVYGIFAISDKVTAKKRGGAAACKAMWNRTTLLRAEHGLTAPFLRLAAAGRLKLNTTIVMDNRRILTG
jgi:hypothetical protein